MFKRLFIKIKPILVKWLDNIEKLEQNIEMSSRVKIVKKREYVISWLSLVVIFISLVIGMIYIKMLENEYLYSSSKMIFLIFFIKIISLLLLVYLISKIYKFFINHIQILIGLQKEQYKKDLVLFWTLVLFNTAILFIFKINNFNFYILPISGFAILLGLLVGYWWTLAFIMLCAVLSGFVYYADRMDVFISVIFYIISSLYALTKVEKIFSRKDLVPIILEITIVNFLTSLSLTFISNENFNNIFVFNIKRFFFIENFNLFSLIFYNIFSGLLSWLIISIFSPVLESIYQRTTNIKLVELSNFNNPLLRRMMTEAPGTYHHSLIVSSLSENVAVNLGLNSLLCKVAGYYHDIGKIINPEYFIENQVAIQNPHSVMNPSLSALVIVNHVKEGVKLAKEYKLDTSIIDIIQQHHGNSIIHGLYDRTLELGLFDKEVLRYPGPKPQTKEAAVIMICDSCEAACRSIAEPDAQKIKETVERVINTKFVEGQFDEVPLTLRDLYKISNIVTQMLISFYHLRTYRAEEK